MSEHKGGQATNDNKQQQQQSEDWTKNPPYALQDPNSKPKVMYSGSCHCKWVTFDLFKDPIDALSDLFVGVEHLPIVCAQTDDGHR